MSRVDKKFIYINKINNIELSLTERIKFINKKESLIGTLSKVMFKNYYDKCLCEK